MRDWSRRGWWRHGTDDVAGDDVLVAVGVEVISWWA